MRSSGGWSLEAHIAGPLRLFCGAAKCSPFFVIENGDGAPLVLAVAGINPVWNCVRIMIALRFVDASVDLCIQHSRRYELDAGFILREIDVLALARAAPVIECGQDGNKTEAYRNEIDVWPIQEHRRFADTVSGQMRETAHRCELRSKTTLTGAAPSLS